jgi:succinate-semialdehyde dehydrogenase / glutarate-semialdehyde dehydrogenase
MGLESRSPVDGRVLATYPEMDAQALATAAREGHRAFAAWREASFAVRGALLSAVANTLAGRSEALSGLMAEEMGKPLAQGRAEVEKCALVCRYYAEHGARFLQPEEVETDAARSVVSMAPLGLILAVMPWNFPLWQVLRFAAPALMAGNAALLKHAANVTGCALAIETCFRDAGAPPSLFQALLLDSARVKDVIAAPEVAAVTLTGSTVAGRSVAALAGHHLKKTVLELGGSDPYLVLDDASLPEAVEACVTSRLINSGQSCIAAKRFLVVGAVREQFEEMFVARMRAQRMGDPRDPATELGPLARHDLRDSLHDQVTRSLAQGARLLLGGVVPPGPGAFYPPTVLTDVKSGMAAHDEETFGPVAAIIPVRDEAEAVRTANQSVFGLGAAVFTADAERGERVAAQLEAGSVFVNTFVRSDPRLPFGGIKESGYGRELGSVGIREFVNVKTTYRR